MRKLFMLFFILLFFHTVFSQSLSLEDCVDLAMSNNPDLQKSDYAVQQSRISSKQALSALLPSVSANASASNSGPLISDAQEIWSQSYGGGVNQQFYYAGMYSGISLAKERQASSEYSNASLRDQIRAMVERLYFQILAADTLVGVYQANIRLQDEQIAKMKFMFDLGLKRESDLLKSKVQRGTFESQLINEMESLSSSKRALNIVLGKRPNDALDILPIDVEQISLPDYKTAYAIMLENNPSIKQLVTQITVQKTSLRIAKEAYLPSLSGSYSASHRNNIYGGDAVRNDQISLQLGINLFDGFSKNMNVQKSKISLDEAQLDYEATLRDLEETLSNQYQALATENELITIHETNLASARKDLEIVSEEYASGLSTILDLTDAQVSVLQSETNLLRDLYTRKQIESQIRVLMGE
ncbi:MAG: TolC family protein [Calditrichaeota bacterium]|nr:MAG: TolC family protein [Calditrichota bacterium]